MKPQQPLGGGWHPYTCSSLKLILCRTPCLPPSLASKGAYIRCPSRKELASSPRIPAQSLQKATGKPSGSPAWQTQGQPSQCLFLSTGPSCGLQSHPWILEQDKVEERSCWPEGQRNALPRAPSLTPLSTCLLFPLHLALPGPPCRASLQGLQQPPASKAPRPR